MSRQAIPVVLLAGGLGTRLREETEFRPKPMVPIGGRPMLWHIMKLYSHYGFYKFIICLGYKGEMIKRYFQTYHLDDIDFTVNTKTGTITEHYLSGEEWEVTLVDTGQECMTGGRIARIAPYISSDRFMLTYGDGLADINLTTLLEHHKEQKRLATLTGVQILSRFGNVHIEDHAVSNFSEKKIIADEWINGGFFVCEKEIFSYLSSDDACVFEQQPLMQLARDRQLTIYKHKGFWQCMDTLREHQQLEALWKEGAPWKIWEDKSFQPAQKINDLKQGEHDGNRLAR